MPIQSPHQPARFLLAGASGMLGTSLTRHLDSFGATYVRLVRSQPGPGKTLWQPEAPRPFADPRFLEGFDAAIALSGANVSSHRWTPAFLKEMHASRIDSTRALARGLAGLAQPPKVLLVASAIGIYGDRGDELLDENSAAGTGILAELCEAWEAAADPARAAGIRVVHLRFGVVLGRGAGALGQMLPVFRMGLGGRLGSGRQWMSWIGLPDLLTAVMFAVSNPEMEGPVNIVSPNPVTNAEFTRILAKHLHRAALLPAPAFALRLVFGRMADEALLASARVAPRRLHDSGFRFKEPTLDQALVTALG